MPWEVLVTEEFEAWWDNLPADHQEVLTARIAILREHGPALGRPTVDTITGSSMANLKELRASAGRAHLRVLFAFDPERRAVMLTGGNKSGQWQSWYRRAIPTAERLYTEHVTRQPKEDR
ncbi:MAG: type II toxin-antitoxin system RelE/ParE family toxin [Acidimicrobiales bacterium]